MADATTAGAAPAAGSSIGAFFSKLWITAENALSAAAPVVGPVISLAEAAVPAIEAIAPSAAPAINVIEAGAASIAAVAPTAVQDATALIAAGRQAYTDLGPAIANLESSLENLFHVTPTPQGVLLTPKTTAATTPATAIPMTVAPANAPPGALN